MSSCANQTQANYDKGFIIPGTIGAIIMWFYFPDTLGKPLEETAALFGDADQVATYMRDIEITEDELDAVGGFGEKSSDRTLEVEKAAAGQGTDNYKHV